MKKRLVLLALGLFAFAFFGISQAESAKVPKFSVGLDYLTFAWVNADETGAVHSAWGFNTGFGISYRSYFTPLAPESGSTYWQAGTILLIDPYVGVGYDYRINEMVYVGGGVDFYPLHLALVAAADPRFAGFGLLGAIVPEVHIGIYLF